MALRSPTSAHSYWGSFANPAALPVGNPNLETGDTAFVVSANSLYAYDGAAWAPATTTAPAGNPNEVQYNSGGALAGDPNFTYDTTNLTVATGGSAIDIGQGIITGNPGLIVETGIGGTLTLGTAGETVDLIGTNILVNSAAGAAGEVLTSNGAGLAPTWQAGGGGGGITELTQDVIAGPGAGSQAATVQGMGGSTSKVHFVIVGGKYATLQDAVNAAAANDTIFVGPIGAVSPITSWGDVTFPAQKRLSVIGLSSPRSYAPNIGKVTFAPAAGLNILENTIHLENLFINASFAGAQGVNFAGTAPARLRMVNCYIYNLSGVSGDAVVVNNSGAGSSCYLDGTTIQGAGTAGVGVNHVQGYTLIRNGCEVADYQYQIQCAAGTVEVYNSQIEGSLANEVIRITGGTVFLGYSTIRNATANSTGVNLVNAGAAFGMGDATFAIATGTGYCVNGVAGSIFLYGPITYSNSAALAYNVKVKNIITAFPITQAFTLSP
jgi:hypothetical protein